MNFWIIQSQENPAQSRSIHGRRLWRSNTLCEVLADRGHYVERWRSCFSHQSKKLLYCQNYCKVHDNYIQRYIYGRPYRNHIGFKRYINHIQLAHNFKKVARYLPTPSLIHVANAPTELMCSVIQFARERDCPVLVDVRDLWPDIYIDLLPTQLSFLKPLVIRALPLFTINLRSHFRKASGITTLTNSYMRWALSMCERKQINMDRIFPMCYPELDESPDYEVNQLMHSLSIKPQHIIALYLGNIGYQSDFYTLFRSARELEKSHPNFRLIIAGSGPLEPELVKLASEYQNVILPGWLDGNQIKALLQISKIGLIAFKPIRNYIFNMPNKFSEYLAGGLAIACGLPGEISSLVLQHGCGFTYNFGDFEMLSESLKTLIDNPLLLNNICANSIALHKKNFNSELVYSEFADFLETASATK